MRRDWADEESAFRVRLPSNPWYVVVKWLVAKWLVVVKWLVSSKVSRRTCSLGCLRILGTTHSIEREHILSGSLWPPWHVLAPSTHFTTTNHFTTTTHFTTRVCCPCAAAFGSSVRTWYCQLIWHVSSSSYDMYPPPHMTCILLLIWHHMTCILLLIWHVSSSSYDMYPPPHMTCILLLIWHVPSNLRYEVDTANFTTTSLYYYLTLLLPHFTTTSLYY